MNSCIREFVYVHITNWSEVIHAYVNTNMHKYTWHGVLGVAPFPPGVVQVCNSFLRYIDMD